jgi:hypothetical protein
MADVTHVHELQGLKLDRTTIDTLQLNIGLYCNLVRALCTSVLCRVNRRESCDRRLIFMQACTHCHVESSPQRTEMMSRAVAERCLSLLETHPSLIRLDLTGGAPELNKQVHRDV